MWDIGSKFPFESTIFHPVGTTIEYNWKYKMTVIFDLKLMKKYDKPNDLQIIMRMEAKILKWTGILFSRNNKYLNKTKIGPRKNAERMGTFCLKDFFKF